MKAALSDLSFAKIVLEALEEQRVQRELTLEGLAR